MVIRKLCHEFNVKNKTQQYSSVVQCMMIPPWLVSIACFQCLKMYCGIMNPHIRNNNVEIQRTAQNGRLYIEYWIISVRTHNITQNIDSPGYQFTHPRQETWYSLQWDIIMESRCLAYRQSSLIRRPDNSSAKRISSTPVEPLVKFSSHTLCLHQSPFNPSYQSRLWHPSPIHLVDPIAPITRTCHDYVVRPLHPNNPESRPSSQVLYRSMLSESTDWGDLLWHRLTVIM